MSFAFTNPLPTDGVTTLAAASVVNPFNDLKTYAVNHQSGVGYRHGTEAIDSEALAAGPVFTDNQVHLQQRINQLAAAVSEIIGITGFSAAVAGLPATISAINTTLTNATAAATPTRLVLRDAVGGAAFDWLNATNTNPGTIVFSLSGANGQTANLFQVQGYGLAAGEGLLIPPTGAITTARQITAPQFNGALVGTATNITGIAAVPNGGTGLAAIPAHDLLVGNGAAPPLALAPGAANNLLFSNGTDIVSAPFTAPLIPDRAVPYLKIANLSITANPASLVVTVNPGSFVNAVGVLKTIAATPVTLIAPTTGPQYAEIWFSDAASVNVTYGTVGGSRDTAAAASPNAPQWIYLPQNCTGIYSSQADWQAAGSPALKGYIDDRPVGGGSSGSGGGGSTSATVATIGAPATAGAANGTQLSAILAGTAVGTSNGENVANIIVSPTIVKRVATDSSISDALWEFYKQDLLARLLFSSAVQVRMRASVADPVTVSIGGRPRTVAPAPGSFIQASAGGASGVKLIVLDLTTVGVGTFALVDPMPDATGFTQAAYQKVIGQVYYDAATSAIIGPIDPTPISNIASRAVALESYTAVDNGTGVTITGDANFHPVSDMTAVTFALTKPCNVLIWITAKGQVSVATSSNSNVYPWLDGAQVTAIDVMIPGAAASTGNSGFVGGSAIGIVPLGIGKHTLSQGTYVATGTSLVLGPSRSATAIILG